MRNKKSSMVLDYRGFTFITNKYYKSKLWNTPMCNMWFIVLLPLPA
ncbi:hypothetical protein LX64_00101 [Chitinophaga skermanii]|uniref:Uncharacterized protein n=1 Tax=Chitinophaga skermanii TaxID=331697 RepID=A0A327R0W7_9BACT|nr:hypothetical protein LX64_00101 [Chitinophaga skermanii]